MSFWLHLFLSYMFWVFFEYIAQLLSCLDHIKVLIIIYRSTSAAAEDDVPTLVVLLACLASQYIVGPLAQ